MNEKNEKQCHVLDVNCALFLFFMASAEVDMLSHVSSSSITQSVGIIVNEPSSSSVGTPRVFTSLSPGGTKEWIPSCSEELKPIVGMNFKDPEEGLSFYKAYATASGFTSRKITTTRRKKTGVVAFQYVVCNKEGFKASRKPVVEAVEDKSDKARSTRRRMLTRVGCGAQMCMKNINGSYVVTYFKEEHNHPLYTPGCAKFHKHGRKMSILHKNIIIGNSKVNIGPVKSFRIMKELTGSYDNVGASKQDFKKIQRDLKALIEGSDAQMFINNFLNKKLLWSAFFYDYELDEEDQLCRAFWADPICRKNYALFGDMVSFDTTFSTNMYNMIFGPFTGVDHHKKCITFAAALISNEDIVSFKWVFKTFVKAMGGNEPLCLITDEDPAMKVAFPKVFRSTEHRGSVVYRPEFVISYFTYNVCANFKDQLGMVTDAGEKNGAQGRESGIWLGGELDPRTARRWVSSKVCATIEESGRRGPSGVIQQWNSERWGTLDHVEALVFKSDQPQLQPLPFP
ncbi:protein FAR1-RELATED SEQUENCE 5-like [Spinacia oleracea]|uniref:Protein FAR1-RELATED SEQUENCE 5-like n=1 Tax=Spinacia oleracea TaxID=3562 RepID=A0ABM3RPQ8_SPIOL|nr:protein FAR1-RELATED SEQUENCE 5-like [Spinacia oleracea]